RKCMAQWLDAWIHWLRQWSSECLIKFLDSRVEEKKAGEDVLVTEGGFVVPISEGSDGYVASKINFMGHTFRFGLREYGKSKTAGSWGIL
ncbi:unnamed protein product, partial [Thlaspi arvense]